MLRSAVPYVLALAFMLSAPVTARAADAHGALLMDGAKKVDTDRYKMSRDWDRTVRFYSKVYGRKAGYSWYFFADTPSVRAIHIENLNRKKDWEGLNIYQTRKGGVYVYVIKAEK